MISNYKDIIKTKENFNELEFSGKEVDNIIKEYEDNGNDTETI